LPVHRKVFRPPHVIVVILGVISQPSREETFAIGDPVVDGVARKSEKGPIAGVLAAHHQFRGATVAQGKARRVRVNSRAAPIAHAQTHAPIARHVYSINSRLLRRHRGPRCVHLEILPITVKPDESHHSSTFQHAQRDTLITQGHDAQRGVGREAHEVSRVDLYLHPAVFVGRNRVAFDQRVIQARAFPILVAFAFETHVPADQADAHDAIFDVVIIGLVVVVEGAGSYGD
jgi:hypothetical protein